MIRWMHACMDGWFHGCMQIEQLRAAGLIKGGSLENALVCRYIE
jgi:UDP-3-O-acyl-N-acetylglucosamine deacetylase